MDLREGKDFLVSDQFAVYNRDCIEGMSNLKSASIDFSVYSPPFASMYSYSSKDEDLGNCKNYLEFLHHYEFVILQISRLTKPGRISAVHCMDIPKGRFDHEDFPGDIIKLYKKHGFTYADRKHIWKEPLRVALRSRAKKLTHKQLCQDSTKIGSALADQLLFFRKDGENEIPVSQGNGFKFFLGEFRSEWEQKEYDDLLKTYNNFKGDQKLNKLSHFIWRRYASSMWDDIRADRMLPYREAKDPEDERHLCPLHLDVIQRAILLYTNPGETVLTPFLGVGSEVYGAVELGRRGIGFELKESYFRQAKRVLQNMGQKEEGEANLFTGASSDFDSDFEGENF